MAFDVHAWYQVTARSDQLIAAIKDESIYSEILGFTANDACHAAAGACLRAAVLIERQRMLTAVSSELTP